MEEVEFQYWKRQAEQCELVAKSFDIAGQDEDAFEIWLYAQQHWEQAISFFKKENPYLYYYNKQMDECEPDFHTCLTRATNCFVEAVKSKRKRFDKRQFEMNTQRKKERIEEEKEEVF